MHRTLIAALLMFGLANASAAALTMQPVTTA